MYLCQGRTLLLLLAKRSGNLYVVTDDNIKLRIHVPGNNGLSAIIIHQGRIIDCLLSVRVSIVQYECRCSLNVQLGGSRQGPANDAHIGLDSPARKRAC